MDTNGTAYILNMCDQAATVTLNYDDGPEPIPPMTGTGEPTEPYHIKALPARREPNPAPHGEFVLGSGATRSENRLEFYLGNDRGNIRRFEIGITQEQLHLNLDCQIFLFYESAVLRFQGNARFYPANQTHYLKA